MKFPLPLLVAFIAFPVAMHGAQSALLWDGAKADYFGDDDGPFTLGFRFHSETDFQVTALGAFDYLGDGFTQSHLMGLWEATSRTLIVTATIGSGTGGTLDGQFRYVDVPAVSLSANTEYIVAVSDFYGSVQDLYGSVPADAFTMTPGLTYLGPQSAGEAAGLVFPELQIGAPFSGVFGANFQFTVVPEPSTWALLSVGGILATAFGIPRTSSSSSRRV
jgi:Domain of unknown function (DUF4082)